MSKDDNVDKSSKSNRFPYTVMEFFQMQQGKREEALANPRIVPTKTHIRAAGSEIDSENGRVELQLVSNRPAEIGGMMMAVDPSVLSQVSNNTRPAAKLRKSNWFSMGPHIDFYERVREMTVTGPIKEKERPETQSQQREAAASSMEGPAVLASLTHDRDPFATHPMAELPSFEDKEKKDRQEDNLDASNSTGDSENDSKAPNVKAWGSSDLLIELKYRTELDPVNMSIPTPETDVVEETLDGRTKAASMGIQAARSVAVNSDQKIDAGAPIERNIRRRCVAIEDIEKLNADFAKLLAEVKEAVRRGDARTEGELLEIYLANI